MALAALVLAPATCEFNNLPWFCKQLPEPTTEDIEIHVHICGNVDSENFLIRTRTHQFNL